MLWGSPPNDSLSPSATEEVDDEACSATDGSAHFGITGQGADAGADEGAANRRTSCEKSCERENDDGLFDSFHDEWSKWVLDSFSSFSF